MCSKEMTLAEESELEIIKECLTYVEEDAHSKSPHRHASYPWTEDPGSLPINRSGVEATFLSWRDPENKRLVVDPRRSKCCRYYHKGR